MSKRRTLLEVAKHLQAIKGETKREEKKITSCYRRQTDCDENYIYVHIIFPGHNKTKLLKTQVIEDGTNTIGVRYGLIDCGLVIDRARKVKDE